MGERNLGTCIIVIGIVLLVLIGPDWYLPPARVQGGFAVNPWGQKGVLNYLSWTADPQ